MVRCSFRRDSKNLVWSSSSHVLIALDEDSPGAVPKVVWYAKQQDWHNVIQNLFVLVKVIRTTIGALLAGFVFPSEQ